MTIGALILISVAVSVSVVGVLWRIARTPANERGGDPDEAVIVSGGPTDSQAEILRSKLEAMGIPAFVKGGSPIPQYGSLWDKAAVLVRRGDLAEAAEILGDEARQP